MNDPRTDEMKEDMLAHYEEYTEMYQEDEHTKAEVVHEDDDCIIVADHSGHELNDWSSHYGINRDALSEWAHAYARQKCDYSWSVSDPVVFTK